ncbi:hypothetical protein N7522_010683 [Penicillium canescens]|uniref:Uncharacterized protein n=1 Tax=Penicillium canescens TaxID=5083 RepID=A0AAD6NC23_PENCN|nr:uncharacterized protein N7446_006280 [Penicillium canescens]KAJ5990476.1 hypothetical protein N7522_010683 [Penicillium canescens]KAJ6051645.1 hypothetical protein N7460_002179 [Penicillium canescens]KAJ6062160.1 hypothetical protein N7446_006280 [Penicillium canescens]KAJ6065408.1 hypothetical protein N7444_001061 [Penicillium canescens]
MSFLTSIRASRQALRTNYAITSTFHTSAVRSLKENDRHREDLATHYESHKQQVVKDSKEGKGKWRAELASSSEEDVKADRGDFDGENVAFDEMQKKTKQRLHQQSSGKQ